MNQPHLAPMINEGIAVYAEGVASAEDIDTAMKLGANHPMGPLALGDLIGLDVVLAIMEVLHHEDGATTSIAPSSAAAQNGARRDCWDAKQAKGFSITANKEALLWTLLCPKNR